MFSTSSGRTGRRRRIATSEENEVVYLFALGFQMNYPPSFSLNHSDADSSLDKSWDNEREGLGLEFWVLR